MFYILPPVLTPEEKSLYKSPSQVSLKPDMEIEMNQVIGEYEDGGNLFYFARNSEGLAHKFPAKIFQRQYPVLVQEYFHKKAAKTLAPFDPSASYVHPSSRVKTTVKLTKRVRSTRRRISSSSGDEEAYIDSEQDTNDDNHSMASNSLFAQKRSTRRHQNISLSPRRTRLRKSYNTTDETGQSDSEVFLGRRGSRRNRSRSVSSVSNYDIGNNKLYSRRQRGPRQTPDSDNSSDGLEPLKKHHHICEKCHEAPASNLLNVSRKRVTAKSNKRGVTSGNQSAEEEEDRLTSLGGWVRCQKCPVVLHWKCLASGQRDGILKALKHQESSHLEKYEATEFSKVDKRSGLGVHETVDFVCRACQKGGVCMGCMAIVPEPQDTLHLTSESLPSSPSMQNQSLQNVDTPNNLVQRYNMNHVSSKPLLFRCLQCKRPAHYEHLPRPSALTENSSLEEVANHYQENGWSCRECSLYTYVPDKILAWRPYPANATETPTAQGEIPNYKASLPREYLVKWDGRSYRRTQWVPHQWLLSIYPAKLKNFLLTGTRVQLLRGRRTDVQDDLDLIETKTDRHEPSTGLSASSPCPDAEQRIPLQWKTIDRVLDVMLWHPRLRGQANRYNTIHTDSDDDASAAQDEREAVFQSGKKPSSMYTETVTQWESRQKRPLSTDDINHVIWVCAKWGDLNYDEATWDSPPRANEFGYEAFVKAFDRYIAARQVRIQRYTKSEAQQLEDRPKDGFRLRHLLTDPAHLKLGQESNLKLMPFQIDGFNWLCNNWWNRQPCILADEMGLGKTIQIITFLGYIHDKFKIAPALVVVPNSTIANWVREFERWAPRLRVVSFHGEAKAREVIKAFELHHESPHKGFTNAKFHVLVATYEALLNIKDFAPVFKSQPRWEVLIVDEGQRLKNDASLLFKKLNELNSRHRIIMTGTPLNNKIRELFSLMNFLDPHQWNDLNALEKEYEELTEDLVKQLHNRLRPYFLRRVKGEVLELPPKESNEVIVPVSMTPLQREVYRSILSNNLDTLKNLTQPPNLKQTVAKKNINNVLMQLRKCLQHPYLYAEDIEPRGLSQQETHEKLIDASAKFRLLKILLQKLKDRGHRVLLFSQFVIALDIIEDFLHGEGYRYLRLDGNTNSFDRQKGMDEFNQPGSDVFMYLLSTRAGGVGINLYSADTVIIFDPDFNPHQDLQAISRAYRYGQQKTCLVFKLMVKDSAEERIMQVGKKKLVLDHLIVQKMDDEDTIGEDVQSILTYGAKALFEAEQESRDILYTDQDIDKLVEKTEHEGEHQEIQKKEGALLFSFAKVWASDKDALEDIQDENQVDSWTHTLQKITAEKDKVQSQQAAVTGRGVRRAAAIIKPNYYVDGSPDTKKAKKKSKSLVSDTSSYTGSGGESDDDSELSGFMEIEHPGASNKQRRKYGEIMEIPRAGQLQGQNVALSNPVIDIAECGLCGKKHSNRPGECVMTDRSEFLAEYREMLIMNADDEPWEERSAAIRAIDEALHRRGHLSLIAGQPLHPLPAFSIPPSRLAPQSKLTRPSVSSYETNGHQWNRATKRPASPANDSNRKKIKATTVLSCPICDRIPHHLVKDCPVILEGAPSISRQIERLESSTDPSVIHAVGVLRKMLRKQAKRELQRQAMEP
ncbi:hypothetical protein AMATHDRAFT_134744 [Amanita thiersii Skay4041]|uniref:Chromatin remodeling factor mit1 n=1 Tax=Amanita thiersii Skay4041 TaxID=703135 RepID=A0A2A9P1V5_9AGAR|nr:hypothetical protein AMATHDRAFT_134744 [Amanita thiersii Skay4041]